MKFAAFCATFVAVSLSVVSARAAETIHAYHIGNSLTDNIYPGGLGQIASQKKDTYVYGKDVSPGISLDMAWNSQTKTGATYSKEPFGTYKSALKNDKWDVMTLEPFDNQISGSTGDLKESENFINYAIKKSPSIQTYIYERWPRRAEAANGSFLPFDYTKTYTKAYTGSKNRFDLADERQGYFTTLVNDLNKALPKLKKSVKLIPVGDVLEKLDQRIKQNKVKGITDITQLYADDIHFNTTGAYVISMTFFSTMFDTSPVGTSVPKAFPHIGGTLASELQNIVWDVVSSNPLDGVKKSTIASTSSNPPTLIIGALVPEPMTVGLLVLLPLLGRRRTAR